MINFKNFLHEADKNMEIPKQSVPTEGGQKFISLHPMMKTDAPSTPDTKPGQPKMFDRAANRMGKNPGTGEDEYEKNNLKTASQYADSVKNVGGKLREDDSDYHKIINSKTGAIVGKAKSLKRARNIVDKKDNEYGAYVHKITPPAKPSVATNTFTENPHLEAEGPKFHAQKLPNGKYQLMILDLKTNKYKPKGFPHDNKEAALSSYSLVTENFLIESDRSDLSKKKYMKHFDWTIKCLDDFKNMLEKHKEAHLKSEKIYADKGQDYFWSAWRMKEISRSLEDLKDRFDEDLIDGPLAKATGDY